VDAWSSAEFLGLNEEFGEPKRETYQNHTKPIETPPES
jgi:hypothetical protein